MATSTVRVLFTGDSRSATRAVTSLERGLGGLGRAAGIAATTLTVGLVGGLAAATKSAADFELAMRNVNSIAKLNEKQFKVLSTRVRGLAKDTGQSPQILAKGLYDIVSSGFEANDALKILRTSAIAASAGMTDTATASKAVVSILNAYHLSADQASKVSSLLFKEVQLGVNTFEELAQNIGDTVPLAAQLKIPFSDVAAGLALITTNGTSMAEASTQMSRVMADILTPGKELAATFRALGYENGQAAIEAHGFVPLIKQLSKEADGSASKTADWFANIRSLRGMLNLTGPNLQKFNRFAAEMAESFRKGGDDLAAFNEISKSALFQWQRAKASLAAAAIPIGELLFPALIKGAEATGAFAEKIEQNMPEIKRQFGEVAGAVQSLGSVAFRVGSTDLGQAGLVGALTSMLSLNVAGKVIAWRTALGGLAGPVGLAAAGVGLLAGGLLYLAMQGNRASESMDRLREALSQQADASRTLEQAQLRVEQTDTAVRVARLALTRATRAAAEAERDFGARSEQARQANLTVEQAEQSLRQARLDRRNALKDVQRGEQALADTTVSAKEREKKAYDSTSTALKRAEENVSALSRQGENQKRRQELVNEVLDAYSRKLAAIDKDLGTSRGTTMKYVAAVRELYAALGRLPSRKEVTIYVRQIGSMTGPTGAVRPRAGGGFVPMNAGTQGRDSVPAMLTPGEIVLNRSQQDRLGGPRHLADLFGFRGDRGARFAGGGIVGGGRPSERLTRASRAALAAVEEVNVRQGNLDRAYGQLSREFDISREEFIVSDANGNERLDEAAVGQRMSEIERLISHRRRMIGLIDEEKRKLNQAIETLEKAIAALLTEIRAEQEAAQADAREAARLTTELAGVNRQIDKEQGRSFPSGKEGESARKASEARINELRDRADRLQRSIGFATTRRDGRLGRIRSLSQTVSEFRSALGDTRSNLANSIPFDRRDVQLDIAELTSEADAIRALNPAAAGSPDGGGGGGDLSGPGLGSITSGEDTAGLQEELRRLREELGRLRLGAAVQRTQLGVIGSFQKGTLHVPVTGPYELHAGERVIPAGVSTGSGGGDALLVQINGKGDRLLERLLEELVDVRVIRQADAIGDYLGTKADHRARAGRA